MSNWWNPFPDGNVNDRQSVFITEFTCLFSFVLILWYSRIILPWKCFATFLHELGHATMVWLFCGKVTGIEVHSDQGGLCHMEGVGTYAQFWILPAGYLGSAAWACAITIMSGGKVTALTIAFILCFFLLLCLGYSIFGKKEKFGLALPLLCIVNLGVLIGLIVWCLSVDFDANPQSLCYRVLEAWLVFLGVVNGVFATWDIVEDCIARKDERSDAYRWAKLVKCCSARIVGCFWFFLSLIALAASFYFGLLMRKSGSDPNQPNWWNIFMYCLCGGLVGLAILYRCVRKMLCCGSPGKD